MRPNFSSNPFYLPQEYPSLVAKITWPLSGREVAAEAFNGDGTGFLTPTLSPATTSPLSPPSIPRRSNENEEDLSTTESSIPSDLFLPVLA
jgi:hypothetical protein